MKDSINKIIPPTNLNSFDPESFFYSIKTLTPTIRLPINIKIIPII
jgi:hypothetical protein